MAVLEVLFLSSPLFWAVSLFLLGHCVYEEMTGGEILRICVLRLVANSIGLVGSLLFLFFVYTPLFPWQFSRSSSVSVVALCMVVGFFLCTIFDIRKLVKLRLKESRIEEAERNG